MPVVVRACGGVGDFGGIGRGRTHRDVRHLRRVVRILVHLPESRVAHERAGRNLLEEFLLRNRAAVVALELCEQSLRLGLRAAQEALVLLEIELAVGLQIRQLRVLRRRRELRVLDDLLLCDGDAALLVFVFEQDLGDDFVVRLFLDLRTLIERERMTALLFLGLDRRLECALIVAEWHVLPIDLHHGRAQCRSGFTTEESRGFVKDEAADERHREAPEDVLAERTERLQH